MSATIRIARKSGPCRVCGDPIGVGQQFRDFGFEARQHLGCELPQRQYYCVATLANGRRVSTRLYNSFDAMHKRCYSPSRWEYDVYGARGIRVCDEWLHNYEAFRAWAIANGFRKNLTLDRIDGTGNYEPSNCRWATREEQTYNTKSVHKLTLNGVTKLLPIWAKELGMTPTLLRARRSSGWTDEQILTTPRLTNGQVRPGVQHKPRGRRPRESSQTSNVSPPNQE